MDCNRGYKRKAFEAFGTHLNAADTSDKPEQRYVPPERARRCAGLPSCKDPRLSDLNIPKDQYLYDTLSTDKKQIRLLKLHPAQEESARLSASLFNVNLSDAPSYEALSYCWGTADPVDYIELDGSRFAIKPNLQSALQTIRRQDRDVHVWVDAICINQVDLGERAKQVGMMGEIYAHADRVLVWLGPGDQQSATAMDSMRHLMDPECMIGNDWQKDFNWVGIAKLAQNSYFSRRWVLQELAFAKETIVLCGDREIHFDDFADALNLIRANADTIRKLARNSQHSDLVCETLDQLEQSPARKLLDMLRVVFVRKASDGSISDRRMDLESLVSGLTHFDATDPRDTIYAVFGLAKDCPSSTTVAQTTNSGPPAIFKPDHHRSTMDVFADFTAYCVQTSERLDIICRPWAPIRRSQWQGDLTDPDLRFAAPSWIPARSQLPFPRSCGQCTLRQNGDSLVGSAKRKVYNADLGRHAEVRFGIDACSKAFDGSLEAKGIVIGKIPKLSVRMADGVIPEEVLRILDGIERDDQGSITSISECIWRTLCANRDGGGEAAPSLYRLALMHLLRKLPAGSGIDTTDLIGQGQTEYIEAYLKRVQAVVWNRKAFWAQTCDSASIGGEDLVGLAPRDTEVGDCVCILFGCSVPVILRPRQSTRGDCWQLIGECYVDGMMDGEAFHDLTLEELQSRTCTFELR